MNVSAVILAGGAGERLSVLSDHRAKPAVPFGGKYRIIDFALSNAVNSGIENVTVLTQYSPRSLISHIGSGRAYGLDSARHGGNQGPPAVPLRTDTVGWYAGTADAVRRNLSAIVDGSTELVVVLAGDHIYKMDYRPFIETHLANAADMTVAVIEVSLSEARRMGRVPSMPLGASSTGPRSPKNLAERSPRWGSTCSTRRCSRRNSSPSAMTSARTSSRRCCAWTTGVRPPVPRLLARCRHPGRLLVGKPRSRWPRPSDRPVRCVVAHPHSLRGAQPGQDGPTRPGDHSLVSHGCIINGTVHNSVLSPGVHLGDGATIRDLVVMVDD